MCKYCAIEHWEAKRASTIRMPEILRVYAVFARHGNALGGITPTLNIFEASVEPSTSCPAAAPGLNLILSIILTVKTFSGGQEQNIHYVIMSGRLTYIPHTREKACM